MRTFISCVIRSAQIIFSIVLLLTLSTNTASALSVTWGNTATINWSTSATDCQAGTNYVSSLDTVVSTWKFSNDYGLGAGVYNGIGSKTFASVQAAPGTYTFTCTGRSDASKVGSDVLVVSCLPGDVWTGSACATPTGTWTAPTCPSACGNGASDPVYSCQGGNGVCSTNSPATLHCNATASCTVNCPATNGSYGSCSYPLSNSSVGGTTQSPSTNSTSYTGSATFTCDTTSGTWSGASSASCTLDVNCVGGWVDTGTCSVTGACGQTGNYNQTYHITTAQVGNGTACPYGEGATSAATGASCSTTACPPTPSLTIVSTPGIADGATSGTTNQGGGGWVTWGAVARATSCTLDGGAASTAGNSYNFTADGWGAGLSKTFTLNCTGPGGSGASSVTVYYPASTPSVTLACPLSGGGAVGQLSWGAVPGLTYFYTRTYDDTVGAYLPAPMTASDVTGSSVPDFTTVPGHTYHAWVHGETANGAYSTPTFSASIACPVPNSIFDASPASCIIAAGQNACSPTISWTSSGVSSVQLQDCGAGFYKNAPVGAQSGIVSVPNGGGCYRIVSNDTGAVLGATKSVTTSCAGGTSWDTNLNICASDCAAQTVSWLGSCSGSIGGVPSMSSNSSTNNVNEYSGIGNFSCSNGTYTYTGGSCVSTPVSGTLSVDAPSCTVADGASTCSRSFTWTTTNPVAGYTSQVVADASSGHNTTPANNGTQSLSVNYGGETYRLYHYSLPRAQVSVSADCLSASAWNGGTGKCQACANDGVNTLSCTNHVCNNGAGDAPFCTPPTLTVTIPAAAGGVITPSGSVSVTYGNNLPVSIVPNSQYSILDVVKNSVSLGPVTSITFTNVTNNSNSLNVTFTQPTGSLSVNSNSCTISTGQSSCTVNATWSTTNPYGTSAITRNNPARTDYTANSGGPSPVTINGAYPSTDIYLYNNAHLIDTKNITTSCTSGGAAWNGATCQTCANNGVNTTGCSAHVCNNGAADAPTCTPPVFTVTASAGPNGTISSAGVNSVTFGNSSPTFTITPNSQYAIASVLIDGVAQGSLNTTPYTYTFTNVQSNHTITTTFTPPTGTIVPGLACSIASGASTCNQSFNWSTANPYGNSQIVADGGSGPTSTPAVSGPDTLTMPYGTRTLRLYNNARDMSNVTITTGCAAPSTWDTGLGKCSGPCSSVSKIWGTGCTQTTALTNSGLTSSVTDSAVPHTGSATYSCSDGTWSLQTGSTCTPPPIITFTNDGPVPYNTPATLSWTTTYAVTCSIDNTIGSVNVGASTADTGNITATTTYTITCSGTGGTSAQSTTVNVGPKPTAGFTNEPYSCTVSAGSLSCNPTLRWTSSNVTAIELRDCAWGLYTGTGAGNQAFSVTTNYPSGCYILTSNGVELDRTTVTATCAAGSTWDGSINKCANTCSSKAVTWGATSCTQTLSPTNSGSTQDATDSTAPDTGSATYSCSNGTWTLQPGFVCTHSNTTITASAVFDEATSCQIIAASSTCSKNISWTSSGLTNVDLKDCAGGLYSTFAVGVATSTVTVPYNSGCYILTDSSNGTELTRMTITSSCAVGTDYDIATGKCKILPLILRVDAFCSATHYSCSPGASSNNISGATKWTWDCLGSNGGANALGCSETKPMSGVAGACSASHYACTAGISANSVNGTSSWDWTCNGTGGGASVSCSEAKPNVINGTCSASHYLCTNGNSINNMSGAINWTWSCSGSGGGTTASCSEVKPAPPLGMSGFITPSTGSCIVANGSDRCSIPFTWKVTNPDILNGSAVTRSPDGATLSSGVDSATNNSLNVLYSTSTFFLYNNAVLLDSASLDADCLSSSAWNGGTSKCQTCSNGGCTNHICNNSGVDAPFCTPPASATAQFTLTPSCQVTAGKSSCIQSISWTSANVVNVSLKDCGGGLYGSFSEGPQSSSVTIPYSSGCYTLNKTSNNVELDRVTITTSCAAGTTYDGVSGTCKTTVAPINASCSGTHYACTVGVSSNNVVDGLGNWSWDCLGSNGGTNALGCSETNLTITNGSCSALHYNCVSGTDVNHSSAGASFTWNCLGNNGGTSASCSELKFSPVNGVCSPTHSLCTAGASSNPATGANDWTWQCDGVSGGTTAFCSESRPINGLCTTTHYACAKGTPINKAIGLSNWTWDCQGQYGGTTGNGCSEPKPVVGGMSGSITPSTSVCSIGDGSDRCSLSFSWEVLNPEVVNGSTVVRNPGATTLSSGVDASTASYPVIYSDASFLLNNNSKTVATATTTSDCLSTSAWNSVTSKCQACSNGGCTAHVCNNGASNAPTCTPPIVPSAKFTLTPSCQILAGAANCTRAISWTSTGVTNVDLRDCARGLYGTFAAGPQSFPVSVPYNSGCYIITVSPNGTELDRAVVTSSCEAGTLYDNVTKKCTVTARRTNGLCASSHFTCSVGSSVNNITSGSQWSWDCLGFNGGTNALGCSESRPTGNDGVCAATHYSCTSGTSRNQANDAVVWTWNCEGSSGGKNVTCNEVKPTGTLSANPLSCIIPVGQRTCNSSFTWDTTNPIGLSQVVADGGSGPSSAIQVSGTENLAVKRGGNTFRLYNDSLELSAVTVGADCAVGWDGYSSVCADPQVISAVITGDYYTNPGTLTFSCSNSNVWIVYKNYSFSSQGIPYKVGTFIVDGDITPVSIPLNSGGNYTIFCGHGDYLTTNPVTRFYNAPPPPLPQINFSITPRTIAKHGQAVLSWDVPYPDNACTLTAKVVCTNNICSADQIAYEANINARLLTELTDVNDPNTSRPISTAITTIAPGHIGTDWKALGRKTFTNILFTTDYTFKCSPINQEVKRIQVSKSQEG